jgi:hypothetical protein
MYFKLRRLDAYHAEYKRIFDQTAVALGSAGEAVRTFSTDGREVLDALSARIDEARAILSELDAASHALHKGNVRSSTSHGGKT